MHAMCKHFCFFVKNHPTSWEQNCKQSRRRSAGNRVLSRHEFQQFLQAKLSNFFFCKSQFCRLWEQALLINLPVINFVTLKRKHRPRTNVHFKEIYEASPRTLLKLVNELSPDQKEVMLVGHNPTFTYLAEYLTKEEIGNMPTCSCVKIKFFNEWNEVSEGTGDLLWFEYHKKYLQEE